MPVWYLFVKVGRGRIIHQQCKATNGSGTEENTATKKSYRGSGGVGFFVRDDIMHKYKVEIVDKETDGIMLMSLTDPISDLSILFLGTYVPPENLVYGHHVEVIFDNLTNLLYLHNSYDMTFVMGDFNSRIGELEDYVEEVDMIDTHCCIDEETNNHGYAFIDFLLEGKLAILNGQICPLEDNFTCISIKGKSIVDYVTTAHENLANVTKFSVMLASKLVEQLNLQGLCEHRASDHSLLLFEFICSNELMTRDSFAGEYPVHCSSGRSKPWDD